MGYLGATLPLLKIPVLYSVPSIEVFSHHSLYYTHLVHKVNERFSRFTKVVSVIVKGAQQNCKARRT